MEDGFSAAVSKASLVPSRDHRGLPDTKMSFETLRRFRPSGSLTHKAQLPLRFDSNAIWFPSGEYCGEFCSRLAGITFTGGRSGSERSRLQILPLPTCVLKATLSSFAEIVGHDESSGTVTRSIEPSFTFTNDIPDQPYAFEYATRWSSPLTARPTGGLDVRAITVGNPPTSGRERRSPSYMVCTHA